MKYESVLTTCTYCGCGCGVYLQVLDGRVIQTLPSKTSPVNQGKLCIKGWYLHEFVHHPNRLKKPLLRRDGLLREVSWEEAMDYAVRQLQSVREKYGPDSMAFLSSARCSNEENYLMQKFSRAVIGTNNVDHCARLCHASTVAGLAVAFGSGAMTNSIEELADADCIFVTGSNTSATHPLVATRLYRAKEKGAKIIVADPRKIPIAQFADISVQQRLGTDVALINTMMHVIYKNGWHNQTFVDERTEGFDEVVRCIEKFTPERGAEITGVAAEDIIKMAEYYAKAEAGSIVYCMGITQHSTGTDNVKSLANLSMLCGHIGRPSTGVNPLRGQNNVQGACDMGALPNVYPGYQAVTVPGVRKKFEEAWNAELPSEVGLTVVEMINAVEEGKIKAMVIMGENPMVSDPDSNHVKHALKQLDFLMVLDIFPTETAQLAHLVLPAACYAEKDGTFTNTERRVQRIRKAVEPPGEAMADWEILRDLSNRMGNPAHYTSAAHVFDEMARLTPSYAGMSYKRLEGKGLCWPCPTPDHPGTTYLHKDKFTRGRGLFHAIDYRPPAEEPDGEYPFWFTTGREYMHYHTGTMTRLSPHLEQEMDRSVIEINVEDAKQLGLREGDPVQVSSRRGTVETRVRVTDRIGKGVLFMAFHFAESAANVLTNAALDPVAKIPEFKVCAVKLKKAA